jgi:hypothetical protein
VPEIHSFLIQSVQVRATPISPWQNTIPAIEILEENSLGVSDPNTQRVLAFLAAALRNSLVIPNVKWAGQLISIASKSKRRIISRHVTSFNHQTLLHTLGVPAHHSKIRSPFVEYQLGSFPSLAISAWTPKFTDVLGRLLLRADLIQLVIRLANRLARTNTIANSTLTTQYTDHVYKSKQHKFTMVVARRFQSMVAVKLAAQTMLQLGKVIAAIRRIPIFMVALWKTHSLVKSCHAQTIRQ